MATLTKKEKTNAAYETQDRAHKRMKMTSRFYKYRCVTLERYSYYKYYCKDHQHWTIWNPVWV